MKKIPTPQPPQTSTAVDALLVDLFNSATGNLAKLRPRLGDNPEVETFKRGIAALIRGAILTELQPLLEEAKEASERSERKELHSNVEGVLSMIEDRIKQLTEEVTE